MTTKRRRKGEGALVERKDSTGKVIGYAAILDLGWSGSKRQRRWFRGKTQREVLDLLAEAKHQAKHGVLPPAGRRNLEAWLEQWLRDVAKPTVRPSTYRGYELAVKQHIVPVLGRIQLDKVTVGDVRAFLNSRKGLSPNSVCGLRAVLRRALNVAIKDGLIPSQRNVAALADPPKVPHREMKAFTSEQAQTFLHSVRGDELETVYVLAMAVGMRQGEILGMEWKNVDLRAGIVRVERQLQRVGKAYKLQEPKSEAGKRTVHLPDIALEALRAHKARQQANAQQPGGIRSLAWRDLVFRTASGQPLNGSWVHHRFQAATQEAGLPILRFHDLRHSCVSVLGAAGVDVAVVSRMVGHSSVSLTLNTYRHVFEKAERAAAAAMDSALSYGIG